MTFVVDEPFQIDIQKVYERLGGRVGGLEVEKAQLLEVIEALKKRVVELEEGGG